MWAKDFHGEIRGGVGARHRTGWAATLVLLISELPDVPRTVSGWILRAGGEKM